VFFAFGLNVLCNRNNKYVITNKKETIMKSSTRKSLLMVMCLFVASVYVMASNDKPIKVTELPQTAQQMLKKYFPKKQIALSKMETGLFDKSYDIIFTNGDKVEFDRNGNWTEIQCKTTAVPAGLIPAAIKKYLKEHYPSAKILEIERDRKGYDVKLSNKLEITFNNNFQVTDIDD